MDWLRHQMATHGYSQHELAVRIGITDQMFTNVVKGRRKFKAEEVDKIRRLFGYRAPEQSPPSIAVAGKVGAGDHVELVDDYAKGAGLFHIERPYWIDPSGVVAAVVDGSSAEPWALDGDIVFWKRDHYGVSQSDLGRPVVCQLKSGEVMLKRLAMGSRPGLWCLLSINPTHPSLYDVEVEWAARALPPLARDCLKIVEPLNY